jgi:hypothetical protein
MKPKLTWGGARPGAGRPRGPSSKSIRERAAQAMEASPVERAQIRMAYYLCEHKREAAKGEDADQHRLEIMLSRASEAAIECLRRAKRRTSRTKPRP